MSGGEDGVVAISSPATGLTVRLIQDHKGAPITAMDLAPVKVWKRFENHRKDRKMSEQTVDWLANKQIVPQG